MIKFCGGPFCGGPFCLGSCPLSPLLNPALIIILKMQQHYYQPISRISIYTEV